MFLRVFKYAAVASATGSLLVEAQQTNKYNKTKKGKGKRGKGYFNGGTKKSKNGVPSTNDYKEKDASGSYDPSFNNYEDKNFSHGDMGKDYEQYPESFDKNHPATQEPYYKGAESENQYGPPARGEFDYGTGADFDYSFDQTFADQAFDYGTDPHNNDYNYENEQFEDEDHSGTGHHPDDAAYFGGDKNHDKMWNHEDKNNVNKPTKEEWEAMSDADRVDWIREHKNASFPTKEEFLQLSDEEQQKIKDQMQNKKNKKGKGKGKNKNNKNMQNMPPKEEWEQMSDAERADWLRENKPQRNFPTSKEEFEQMSDEEQQQFMDEMKNFPSKEEFEQMSDEEQQQFMDEMKNKKNNNKNNKKGKGKNNKKNKNNKKDKFAHPPRSDEEALEFADDDAFVLIDQAEQRLREMKFDLQSMQADFEALEEGDEARVLLSEDIALLKEEIAFEEQDLGEQKKTHRGNLSDKLSKCKDKLEALKATDDGSDPKSVKLIGKIEDLIAKAEKHQQEREAYESMSDEEKQAFRDDKRREKQEKQRQKMQDKINKIEDPAKKQKAEEKLAAFEAERARIEAMTDEERKEYLKQKKADKLEDQKNEKDLNQELKAQPGFDLKKETNATLEIIGASEGDYSLDAEDARAVLGAAIADAAGVDVSDVEVGEVIEDAGEFDNVAGAVAPATADDTSASSSGSSTSGPYNTVPATAPTKRFLQKQEQPAVADAATGDNNTDSASNSKVFRASCKYGVKSDSEAKARYVEKALTQRGFGDAVVTGFNSRKQNETMEFGGAMNKNIQTNDVLVEQNNRNDENSIEKFINDAKALSWQMIAALVAAGMIIAGLFVCFCRACCGSSRKGEKNRPAVELKRANESSYTRTVDSSLQTSQTLYTPTVAWTRMAKPASMRKE